MVSDSATPRTVSHKALLSIAFSRKEYWSGLPFPSPGDLPDRRMELRSLALQADSLLSEPLGTYLESSLKTGGETWRAVSAGPSPVRVGCFPGPRLQTGEGNDTPVQYSCLEKKKLKKKKKKKTGGDSRSVLQLSGREDSDFSLVSHPTPTLHPTPRPLAWYLWRSPGKKGTGRKFCGRPRCSGRRAV